MLIAVSIFSGVILALAGLAYQIARRSTQASDQALQMGRLLGKVDVVSVVPFDSLPTLAGCDVVPSAQISVTACVGVQTLSPRTRSITITVYTSVPGSRPDTVVIFRSRDRAPIPLR